MKKLYFLLFLFCFSVAAFAATHKVYSPAANSGNPSVNGTMSGGGIVCTSQPSVTVTLSYKMSTCNGNVTGSGSTTATIGTLNWYVVGNPVAFATQANASTGTSGSSATFTTAVSIPADGNTRNYYAIFTWTAITGACNTVGPTLSPTLAVTVSPNPSAITPSISTICSGVTYTLNSTPAGGAWSSSAAGVASVTAGGVLTPLASGSATITYSLSSGCKATVTTSVTPSPTTISLVPPTATICSGQSVPVTVSGGLIPKTDSLWLQQFNSSTPNPPNGWTVVDSVGGPAGQWSIVPYNYSSACIAYNFPAADSDIEMVTTCSTADGDPIQSALWTQEFSLSGYTSASLAFDTQYGNSSGDHTAEVDITTDGGLTWQTLANYHNNWTNTGPYGDDGYGEYHMASVNTMVHETIDLSSYLSASNVYIKFVYEGTGASGPTGYYAAEYNLWNSIEGWWVLDNIAILVNGTQQVPLTWSPTSGLSCNCFTPSASPSVTTIYTVTASNSGCNTTATSNITVNPTPSASISPTPYAPNGCGSQLLTASTNTGNAYQWYTPGGFPISGATAATYSAISDGSYYVNVYNSGTGCNSNSSVTSVLINPMPTASVTPLGATTACGSLTLTAGSDIGNVYQWYNGANSINGATNATYVATVSGSYSVNIYKYGVPCTTSSPLANVTINPIPSASINPAGTITACGNQILTSFTDIGDTYQWYSSSGPIPGAGANSSSYTATSSDLYSVKITNASTGCSSTSGQVNVTIKTAPTATITTPSNATSACSGMLMTANTNLGTLYQWYNSAGPIAAPSGTASTYSTSTTDNYYVAITYTVTGCTTNSAIDPIIINPFPVASISAAGSTTVCNGNSVLFVANTGQGITYQWLQNGIIQISSTLNTFSANTVGSYNVIETAGYNCADTSNILTMSTYPDPTASILPDGSTSFCDGGSVDLYASTSQGVTYEWLQNGTPVVPNDPTDTFTASSTGIYTIKVTNSNNCSFISQGIPVTVNEPPIPFVIPAGTLFICDSSSITLSANTATGMNYQWLQNNTNVIDAFSHTYNATSAGTYKVTETDINGCQATSGDVIVNVNPLPVPVIVQNGITLSTTGTYATYQWYQNGHPLQGATNSSYDAPTNGPYTVQVSDNNGCFGYSEIQWVINEGIANISTGADVTVYPNPNNGLFTLNGTIHTKDNKIQIHITDVTGKVILSDQFEAKNGLINEQLNIDGNLPSGIYLIKLVSDEQTVVLPFVKK